MPTCLSMPALVLAYTYTQVVHSRTFANAARTGGVGVRMLVPLVDMINHGGDVTATGSVGDAQSLVPTDNVR